MVQDELTHGRDPKVLHHGAKWQNWKQDGQYGGRIKEKQKAFFSSLGGISGPLAYTSLALESRLFLKSRTKWVETPDRAKI